MRGSLPGGNPGKTSGLPKLGRQALIREVQAIVLQFPTKEMADLQDATTKAVESQRSGDSAMSLLAAVNCARSNPRAKAMFAKLFGFSGAHTDPDFMQGMELLAKGYMRQQLATYGFQVPEEPDCHDDLDCAGDDRDDLTGDLFEVRH